MAVLVFDEKYNLMGTLTLKDILRGLEPRFLKPSATAQVPEEDEAGLSVIWDTLFTKRRKSLAEKPVNEIMVAGASILSVRSLLLQRQLI